jgi:MinD-like ATPase involved in chromosome partitioning or flagellar assembly
MTTVAVAVDGDRGESIARALERAGVEVVAVVAASAPAAATADELHGGDAVDALHALDAAEVLVLHVARASLTAGLVAACDGRGIRILPLCASQDDERTAATFGLAEPLDLDADGWRIAAAIGAAPAFPAVDRAATASVSPRVIAVWGPSGAPGRSALAVELAVELSRGGRRVGLVDADTHAPSLALALGIADEGPGFAAACRQAERGRLDAAELDRISIPVAAASGRVDVLAGINRTSRWPELGGARVSGALATCRGWADYTVVDVAASLERDEEIVSDLADGPRRNAATIATLQAADLVVAVVAADPVGVARFLRAYPELRATIGSTRVVVVVNRLRPGALGIDARGQVRRTLERFAGIRDVWFVPQDAKAADAALLAARPIADVSPRSALVGGVRRLVGEAIAPAPREPSRTVKRVRAPRRARPGSADQGSKMQNGFPSGSRSVV